MDHENDLCFELSYYKSSIVDCCNVGYNLYWYNKDQMFESLFCDHLHQSEWRLEGVAVQEEGDVASVENGFKLANAYKL